MLLKMFVHYFYSILCDISEARKKIVREIERHVDDASVLVSTQICTQCCRSIF